MKILIDFITALMGAIGILAAYVAYYAIGLSIKSHNSKTWENHPNKNILNEETLGLK